MARRGAGQKPGGPGGAWLENMGEALGVQLGKIIAASLQRTLEISVDVGAIAERMSAQAGLAAGRGRSVRKKAGAGATCSVPGCGKVVLAKGLCRSHYYRARYRAQKSAPPLAGRGRRKGAARPAKGGGA